MYGVQRDVKLKAVVAAIDKLIDNIKRGKATCGSRTCRTRADPATVV